MDGNKLGKLEAFLFQYGEPVSVKKIAKVTGIKEAECKELLKQYRSEGLTIIWTGDSAQLVTKPEFEDITKALIKDEFKEELTPATLDVLTIIAYLGPVTRANIDFIRGVNSSFSIRGLLMRGLISREREGNTFNYSVTADFLKHIGLGKVSDLPEYEKYKNILKEYEIT